MNILTLNKTQAKKLVKLCKEFFPEYNWSFENDYADEGLIDYWLKGEPWHTWELVHWYQLCLTELSERIFNKINFPEVSLIDLYIYHGESLAQKIIGYNQAEHPVDFLWNFVQECKKNKYFK